MADFVAVPFGTVNHEHGERRQIQNLRNNLKSSSGIERIPFNGIDELDTEQGAGTVNAIGALIFFGTPVTTLNTVTGTLTNANGTVSYSLTFTPAEATLEAFTAAFADAWNLSSNARLSEYTATGSGNALIITADASGSAFNISVFNYSTGNGVTSREGRVNTQTNDGKVVHALNTGDSRIRFVGSGWNTNSGFGGGDEGTVTRTTTEGDYAEITFFGTGFNALTWVDNTQRVWFASVDGGVPRMIYPVASTLSAVLINQNTDMNVILPVASNLSPGVHTVKITRGVGQGGTEGLTLFGCEIINESTGITQQPGADFDGRVEALSGTTFPIEPDDSTVPSVNGRNLDGDAATYGTHADGARVLNYLTSGGQYKQSFNLADEAPVVQVAGEQEYIIEIQNGGSSSVTLPTSVTNFILNAYGAGGGGGGSTTFKEIISPPFVRIAFGGGGGGGGGQAQATFVRDTSTQAETIALSVPGTASGGAGGIFVAGVGGSNGGNTTVTVGGTQIAFGGGAAGGFGGTTTSGGGGGNAGGFSTATFTGWNISSAGGNTGANGSAGSGESKNSNSSGISDANGPGGSGGSVGGVGNSPLISPEGNGGGGGSPQVNGSNGNTPGGGAGGGGSQSNSSGGAAANGGIGEAGRVYLVVTGAAGLTNTSFGVTTGEFTAGSLSGAALGATTAIFGNATFDANRLNQQVIRRINFREFGANNNFATLGDNSGSATDISFTLDDGTTTLLGIGVYVIPASNSPGNYVSIGAITAANQRSLTFTFVGTGLDVLWKKSGTLEDSYTVLVDGLTVGTITQSASFDGILPIVSGLAYGTHKVRFINAGGNDNDAGITDFIIYGPKKPEVPTLDVGSLELSDYNIMADYDASTSGGQNFVSKGTLGKTPLRDFLYAGTIPSEGYFSGSPFGHVIDIQETGNANYTFYGTGIEYNWTTATASATPTALMALDGNTLSTTNFSISLNGGTRAGTGPNVDIADVNCTFAVGTGIVTRVANARNIRSILQVSVLDLGVHTLRMTDNASGDGDIQFSGAYIITPIHINDDNLKVGSEGLNNLTIDPVVEEDEAVVQANLGEAKAWVHYDGANGTILSSYNIAAVLHVGSPGGGTTTWAPFIYFDKPFKDRDYVAIATPSLRGGGGGGDSVITFGATSQANFATFSVVARLFSASTSVSGGIVVAFYGELIDE